MHDGLSWHYGDTSPKDIIWKVCFAQHIMQQEVSVTQKTVLYRAVVKIHSKGIFKKNKKKKKKKGAGMWIWVKVVKACLTLVRL